ncbi:MAG: tRNA (adenosine(37)-N6)-threonylcarbamoyltransferase complex transferase subunit TsaD, partial [Deltaproteobacteria bacterium]
MLVLGVESSCDECSAAVVTEGPKLLGQVVASQISIHREYGGVVPELASRDHVRKVTMVIDGALSQA